MVRKAIFRCVCVGRPYVGLIHGLLDFSTYYEIVISKIEDEGSQSEKFVGENFRLKSKSIVLND